MDKEVGLVWNSRLSLAKVLFFLNRYYIFAAAVFCSYGLFWVAATDEVSSRYFQWESWSALVSIMMAQAILQLRIYAVYLRNRKILVFMLVSYITASAAAGWILWGRLNHLQATVLVTPGWRVCVSFKGVTSAYKFWIPLFIFDAILSDWLSSKAFRDVR
ncbi:hypothetical protein GALMADRAFT_1085779 [Galerina marginata CBS 339.88]|uniref:DUF6533 domain-containing protein n=1 Tax=Galerina marginata (strain CBS 339.88) TaxID=685588 RepID=A0A067SBT5_GALM3|nr:hypothetical protein GALMADRAFT_1085779 [Galerina marginata CBS 339.88]